MVRFIGWRTCPQRPEDFHGVFIVIGTSGYTAANTVVAPLPRRRMYLPFSGPAIAGDPGLLFGGHCNYLQDITRQECIENVAVHEFGHALGFYHEQMREDTERTVADLHCNLEPGFRDGGADTYVGPWDEESIMSYCKVNPNYQGYLSRIDTYMVQAFYGNTPKYSNDTHIVEIPVVIATGAGRYAARLEPIGNNRWQVEGLRRVSGNSVPMARFSNNTLTLPFVAVYQLEPVIVGYDSQDNPVYGDTQQENIIGFYQASLRRETNGTFRLISVAPLPGQD